MHESIGFGYVRSYINDRGFGFMKNIFSIADKDEKVFFHISEIKKTRSCDDLLNSLENFDRYNIKITLWFEFGFNEKGCFVKRFIGNNEIIEMRESLKERFSCDVENARKKYLLTNTVNTDSINYNLLNSLLSQEEFSILENTRRERLNAENNLLKDLNNKSNSNNIERILDKYENAITDSAKSGTSFFSDAEKKGPYKRMPTFDDIWNFRQSKIYEKEILNGFMKSNESSIEEYEYKLLKSDLQKMFILDTNDLKKRILGRRDFRLRYGHIVGTIKMVECGREFTIEGAVAPEYFRRLCVDLRLSDMGTSAIVTGFVPYKNQ